MSDTSSQQKNVRVQIRFLLAERFEVVIETDAQQSTIGEAIGGLISAIQVAQEEITKVASQVEVAEFKPLTPEAEADPMSRLASKLNLDVEKLGRVILLEDKKVYVICKREMFGRRGGGEKAALVILYAYKYAFSKAPTNEEVDEAYQKLNFKPRAFSVSVKPNLSKLRKIDEKRGAISIEPRAIIEAKTVIREISKRF